MKKLFDKLWNGFFAEECASSNTEEERVIAKKVIEIRKTLDKLLTPEQLETAQKYIDALYEMQSFSVKKAFLTGLDFGASLMFHIAKD